MGASGFPQVSLCRLGSSLSWMQLWGRGTGTGRGLPSVPVVCPEAQLAPRPSLPLLPSPRLWTWYWECLTALFFVLSGPCFDRESTPYQFPNLSYSSEASSKTVSSREPCGGLQHSGIAPSYSGAPALQLVIDEYTDSPS